MKAIIFSVLLFVAFTTSFDEVRSIVSKDECASSSMEILKPEIQIQIQKLKQNSKDLVAKADLLALVQKAKQIFEACNINQKVAPVLGDAVKATGIGFLLASNCFKDVGAVLLISDQIIEDPKDIVNDIVVLIFVALLGKQSYADCQQFIRYVI